MRTERVGQLTSTVQVYAISYGIRKEDSRDPQIRVI
jgi:hypothetical protein